MSHTPPPAPTQTTHPLFTPRRMKVVADVVVALDLALLILIWLPGAIYLIVNLDTECFAIEFIIHFIILLHFALGMAIANVSSEIEKEEEDHKEKFHERFMSGPLATAAMSQANPEPPPLMYVSYRVYSPLSWSFTSMISLTGDAVLLIAASRTFNLGIADECQNARIAHIAYDVVALALSLVSIIWFILFSVYVIAPQRRSERLAAMRAQQARQQHMAQHSPNSGYNARMLQQQQQQKHDPMSVSVRQRMELCGLKYVASLPHHYAGPRHELRRTVRLNPATCRGAGWIADTMLQLKDIVTEEISKHSDDMASFNAFTSRLTDPEPYVTGTSNAGGENDGTTHGGTKSLLNTIEMTVIVTLCFIDKGG